MYIAHRMNCRLTYIFGISYLFNWFDVQGEPVPHVLTNSHIVGPLWATRGNETFSFLGAYNWCKQEHTALQKELKLCNDKLAKVGSINLENPPVCGCCFLRKPHI